MTTEESLKKYEELKKFLEKDEYGLYIHAENYHVVRANVEIHDALRKGLGDEDYRLLMKITR